jgi:hypothetical protein
MRDFIKAHFTKQRSYETYYLRLNQKDILGSGDKVPDSCILNFDTKSAE